MRTSARIGQFFEHDFAGHAPIGPTLEPARQSASNPIAAINPNVNFIVGSLSTAPIPSQVRTGLTAGGRWISNFRFRVRKLGIRLKLN
jgi:hypothetical protein